MSARPAPSSPRQAVTGTHPTAGSGPRPAVEGGLPARFGKYTLIKKLATGGMAELFLAIQKSVAGFEKLLVIKRILPPLNQDQAFVDMLLHEARIAAQLSHPNIVQIFDVGQVDGTFYIAMEHVHGEDLRHIVRQMKQMGVREFPLEHALGIVLGVCAGLAYAHERSELDGSQLNIVHRDISPQNVVVTFSGDVKVVDFGIAKSDAKLAEDTKTGKLKGKVPYMSPEQARGEVVDARSDIFSTGVMLFELTTGKRLFKGASEYETLKLICDRDYPRPSHVVEGYPAELEAIVGRALERSRDDRFQTAREMQSALESFVRTNQVPVSSVALQKFMQTLFEEKLQAQKEALLAGKQLADIIEMQTSSILPDATMELDVAGRSLSMPAASRTVTELSSPAYRNRRLAGLVGGVVLLGAVGGLAGHLLVRRGDGPTATAPAAARAALAVDSSPPGAAIWVNGALRAETTPARLDDLPADTDLDVRLTKDGWEAARTTLRVAAGDEGKVKLSLSKGPFAVELRVRPDAAQVTFTVDGTPRQGPLFEGLESGRAHEILLQAPGFEDRTLRAEGSANERSIIDVTLVRAGTAARPTPARTTTQAAVEPPKPAGAGRLNVGASGGWCNVAVDGAARGPTPVAGLELAAGAHKVTCTTAEGKTLTATVQVAPNDTTRHKFAL